MKRLLTSHKLITALFAVLFTLTLHNISNAQTHIHVDAVKGINAATGRGAAGKAYKSITYALLISEKSNLPDPWHVYIHPGTYDSDPAKPANEREIFPLKLRSEMVFEGTTSAAECIIDAQHLGGSQVEILLGLDVEGVVIRNLTIQNMNRNRNAGGISLLDSAGTLETPSSIEACIIHNNTDGGLVANMPIILIGNTFSNNALGIWANKSISASSNTFINNRREGLYIEGDSAGDLTGNTFQNNGGSGLYITGTLNATVTDNIFTGNQGRGFRVGAINGTITDNTFNGNREGGFEASNHLTGNISKNTFESNGGSYGGGFVVWRHLTGNISDNTFTANSTSQGGGFHVRDLNGNISGNTFTANSAGGDAGGFKIDNNFTGNVTGNEFTKNSSRNGGGAFWIRNFAGNISNNLFDGNSARFSGAFELHNGSENKVEVFNNIFFNNTATESGGSIITRHATQVINNLFMISDELSGGVSGGATVELTSPQCRFHNNIFDGVQTPIRIWDAPYEIPITHNLFHNIKVGFVNQAGNDLGKDMLFWELLSDGANNNLEGAPLLVDPAGSRDFQLQAASPAIDAGVDLYAPADDFDGVARPIGGPVDIGPYEYKKSAIDTPEAVISTSLVWDVNEDGQVSVLDLIVVAQNLGQPISEAPRADVNGDKVINIFDLILVSQHLGERAAPSLHIPSAITFEPSMLEAWLKQARLESDGSRAFQNGIAYLERLLASQLPRETALLPNYPNPFNPETWIPYQLANPAADVTLRIYAVDGSLVRTLSLGHKAVGIYQSRNRAAYWDGKNEIDEPVASGVYFYTLTAGDFTATRKMLIRK